MNCEYIIKTKDGGIISIPSSKTEFSEDNFYEALGQLDVKELTKLFAMIQTTKNTAIPYVETVGISDNTELFDTILTSLSDNFGIKTVRFSKDNYGEIQPLSIENLNTVKAFSKDGIIYVNETEGTIDEPLHEFMHLILNTLKSSNPSLFQNIVTNMHKIDGYEKIAEMYPNLTRLDLNEEAFVRLFSEKATQLMQNTDLLSAVNQTLTDIFKPDKDTSKTDTEELLDLSIIDFINTFGSGLVSGKQGLYNKSDSNLGAQILNIKQTLMESNDLKETC